MEITIAVLLLVAIWYVAQFVMYQCAERNILWTIPKEGTAIAIMRNGEFDRMALRYAGHTFAQDLKEDSEDVLDIYDVESESHDSIIGSQLLNIIFPVRGLVWIGIPPFFTIYRYPFKWCDDHFETREEELSSILIQHYIYGIALEKIELEGGIPYTIRLLVTFQITNPAKALFRVKRWLDTSIEQISGWARTEFSGLALDDFVAPTIDDLSHANQGPKSERLIDAIKRIHEKTTELSRKYGVSTSSIQIERIDPSDERLRDVIIAQEVAEQEGKAKIITAEADARVLTLMNEAAEKLGEKGLYLKGLEMVKNATFIAPGVPSIPLMLGLPKTSKEGDTP